MAYCKLIKHYIKNSRKNNILYKNFDIYLSLFPSFL